jgi:hypothetical protein
MSAGYDTFVELLESMEHFLKPLDIYTEIPSRPPMDEIVVKIMLELFSVLALATKTLKQGRPSESVLPDVIRYSVQRSEIRKEASRREGRRGSPTEA